MLQLQGWHAGKKDTRACMSRNVRSNGKKTTKHNFQISRIYVPPPHCATLISSWFFSWDFSNCATHQQGNCWLMFPDSFFLFSGISSTQWENEEIWIDREIHFKEENMWIAFAQSAAFQILLQSDNFPIFNYLGKTFCCYRCALPRINFPITPQPERTRFIIGFLSLHQKRILWLPSLPFNWVFN